MQPAPAPTASDALPSRFVYVAIAAVMTTIVIVAFWPSFFGPVLGGASVLPAVLHLHGAVFTGWMFLFLAQAALVATGRTNAHRKLGRFGILYGIVIFLMGLVVTFAVAALELDAGEMGPDEMAGFMVVPLGDMALFGGFFGAAIWYRKQPEIHKRLMVLATQSLLFAAFGRWRFILTMLPLPIAFLVWLTPLFGVMVYEGITRRRVHPVYVIGLSVLIVASFRGLLAQSEAWLRIGRILVSPLL